jgi:hypothetical protein
MLGLFIELRGQLLVVGWTKFTARRCQRPASSGISETSTSRIWGGLRAALRQAAYRRSIARTASGWAATLWQSRTWRASRVRSPPQGGPLFLSCDKHPETAGALDRLARVVNITNLKDGYAVLPCSSSLVRSTRARGGGKSDHCWIPYSSVARDLWDRDYRLPQTRHLWSPSDRAPSPCRHTHDRDDRRPC